MDLFSPEWMHEVIQAYGLWVVFLVVMLESMGVPVPGETALVSAAVYAGSTEHIGIASVVIVAAAAAVMGGNGGYLIGRSIGIRLITRYGKYVRLNEARLKVGQYLFLRHGGKIIFFGRFVALLRTFAALLAGANRMNWVRFLVINALGGVCWASVFGAGGYLLGGQMQHAAGPVSLALLILTVGLITAGLYYFRHHEKQLEERAKAALPGHWSTSISRHGSERVTRSSRRAA